MAKSLSLAASLKNKRLPITLGFLLSILFSNLILAQVTFHNELTFNDTASHQYHVKLSTSGWQQDSVVFYLPNWTPGYYQIMNFGKSVQNYSVKDQKGNPLSFQQLSENSWSVPNARDFIIEYDIQTSRKFVANSYVDDKHAFIIPSNSFLYVENHLNSAVTVEIILPENWHDIATGLEKIDKEKNTYTAPNFDILFDSPLLIGNLEKLPSFEVEGVAHHFIGFDMGDFDHEAFIDQLSKAIQSSVDIIRDIPFEEYTFIAIGPGRGGIEHLNNTVFSFSGNGLENAERMNAMLNFLTHEYFHHYNVKRIRPLELGPFDYQKENRTNLLWVSEGFTVYYEYLIIKRAGVSDEKTLFANLESNINQHENNPGKHHQSLVSASFNTWRDGPFGTNFEKEKSISYYQKGPIIGLLLDFAIRNRTENSASLDDVMRLLYSRFYQEKQRGFTDAEFQQVCEEVAQTSLHDVFEFVYSTAEIDYEKYLNYAGLKLVPATEKDGRKIYKIERVQNATELQNKILASWLGDL